jgi:N-acyl-D-amino-acid deacylase
MFDLLIKNGEVIDGTGQPRFKADLAVQGDKIAAIDSEIPAERARKVIDVAGHCVCPGFIDIHSHTDCSLFVNPRSESKIRQGVTTDISGNCGMSPCPISDVGFVETKEFMKTHKLEIDWEDLGGFFGRLEKQGIGTNYGTFIGHGSLRTYCMGEDKRPPTPEEMAKQVYEMDKAMEQGALGLTTGLIYPPGCFAEMDEIVEVAKAAAAKGGIYASHMRSEGQRLLEAITETITIGQRANIPVEISHLKVAGFKNWGKGKWAIELIELARKAGLKVHADRYPYIASSTELYTLLPDWAHDGGIMKMLERLKTPDVRKRIIEEIIANIGQESGYEDTLISAVHTEKNNHYQGMTLQAIAAERNQPVHEAICDILLEEDGMVSACFFSMNDEETDQFIAQEWLGIGSDTTARAPYPPLNADKPHPRAYGTFPRMIAHYVKQKELFSVEEAVRKMTGLNADILGLKQRGLLKKDYFADVVVFNEKRIKDMSTFMKPHQYPIGIDYVIVNGSVIIEEGIHTGVLAGKIVRNH